MDCGFEQGRARKNFLTAQGEREESSLPRFLRHPEVAAKRPSKDAAEVFEPSSFEARGLRRSHLRMTKFSVSGLLTCVTVLVTYSTEPRPIGRGPAGMPDRAGECGARARICNPLPGGFGHQPRSTRTTARGAFAGLGQAGAGKTRQQSQAKSQEAWPKAESLAMEDSLGREPRWNADGRAPHVFEARPGPYGSAEYSLRLSAFRLRIFSFS